MYAANNSERSVATIYSAAVSNIETPPSLRLASHIVGPRTSLDGCVCCLPICLDERQGTKRGLSYSARYDWSVRWSCMRR